jgi:hypothetical protein
MGSGGARLRSGPAPDPNALRRDREGRDWVKLPHVGRPGDPPPWPEEIPAPTVAEQVMWTRLWHTPQALVWEADGVVDTVALYVRQFIACGAAEASVARLTLLRQLQDSLLLSIPALHAARYTIGAAPVDRDAEAEARSRAAHPAGKKRSARALLTVVEPDPDGDDEG